jgi:hypothetical protein
LKYGIVKRDCPEEAEERFSGEEGDAELFYWISLERNSSLDPPI